MGRLSDMRKLEYQLDGGPGGGATLGLIVLKTDEVLENEARWFVQASDIALHHTRIESAETVSEDTLAAMREALPDALSMLPEAAPFDVIGYGCTSGATVIGADGVASAVNNVWG